MTFDRLHHMQLAMPRAEERAARDFFVGVLGMTEVDKPPVLGHAVARGSEQATSNYTSGSKTISDQPARGTPASWSQILTTWFTD